MFDTEYRMLGAGAWGWSREMIWGGRWEGGSGLGIHVHPWQIHVNVWQNQYSIVKQNKVKKKKRWTLSFFRSKRRAQTHCADFRRRTAKEQRVADTPHPSSRRRRLLSLPNQAMVSLESARGLETEGQSWILESKRPKSPFCHLTSVCPCIFNLISKH